MRRPWTWIITGTLAGGLLAVWVALPWLTVVAVQAWAPQPLDRHLQLTGAGWVAPAGEVTLRLPAERAWRESRAWGGPWFPRRCLMDGQCFTGLFADTLPVVLTLGGEASEAPRLTGRPTTAQVDALIGRLRTDQPGWDVGIQDLTMVSAPPATTHLARIDLSFRGHLVMLGMALDIERLEASVVIAPDRQATVHLTTLVLRDGPGEGLQALLGPTLSALLTRHLQRHGDRIPWDLQIDLQVGRRAVEL